MKIVFISNYMNHHQLPMSDALYNILGDENYYFVQTELINKERLRMGWHSTFERKYILDITSSIKIKEYARELSQNADVVIIGACKNASYFLEDRRQKKKITFLYSERLLKKTLLQFLSIKRRKIMNEIYNSNFNPNEYLLCSSAYAAFDFSLYGLYKDRMFKWGYFPKLIKYDLNDLMKKKQHEVKRILWVGRYINWKHPDDAIRAVSELSTLKYHLTMIGTGPMENNLKNMVIEKNIKLNVTFLPAMSPEKVRKYMELANIYLFTSDYNEGWGAVLNEAMNSGCTVIASHAAGATPFMVKQGKNGFIYKSGDTKEITNILGKLLKSQHLCSYVGQQAYKTIVNMWNAELAASRIITLCNDLKTKDLKINFNDGPCSKAENIKQWNMYKKIKQNNNFKI